MSRNLKRIAADQHGAVSVVQHGIRDGTQKGSLEGSHPSTADDDEAGFMRVCRFADLLPRLLALQNHELARYLCGQKEVEGGKRREGGGGD